MLPPRPLQYVHFYLDKSFMGELYNKLHLSKLGKKKTFYLVSRKIYLFMNKKCPWDEHLFNCILLGKLSLFLKPSQKATARNFHQHESDKIISLWYFCWTLYSNKQICGASYHRTQVFLKVIFINGPCNYFSIVQLW